MKDDAVKYVIEMGSVKAFDENGKQVASLFINRDIELQLKKDFLGGVINDENRAQFKAFLDEIISTTETYKKMGVSIRDLD